MSSGPISAMASAWLALAPAIAIAGNYYAHALLKVIESDLGLPPGAAGATPAVTLLANAAGIVLLVPLGDIRPRRGLVVALVSLLGLSQMLVAASGDVPTLLAASALLGFTSAVTQILIPLSLHFAPPGRQGLRLGVVTGAIFASILLARTYAGLGADLLHWRAVYGFSGFACLGLALGLRLLVPALPAEAPLSYRAALGSLFVLWRKNGSLRASALAHGCLFAAFTGLWSILAFQMALPPISAGPSAVGMLALVGLCGAIAAPGIGRLVDRKGWYPVATAMAGLGIAAFAGAVPFGAVLPVLVLVVLVVDLAVQASQVAHQSRILDLAEGDRNRLNTLFMAAVIAVSSAGSGVVALVHAGFGWAGACLAMALLTAASLVITLRDPPEGHRL